MTAAMLDLPNHLRSWGLDVVEVTGWQTRRRPGPGPFAPVGVLVHHTAGAKGKDAPSLQLCIDGRKASGGAPALPGPLCQILIARSGKVYVISIGRCNHAGTGGPLAGVVGPDQGNAQLIGIELENDGLSEPWPAVQLDASVRTTAAVLDLIRRPRSHCWAHREYTPRKPDPRNLDMLRYRHAVALAQPATPVPPGGTMPTPTTTANPYPEATAEALELLAQHAGYVGDRKWFGPDALKALHQLKNRADDLAKANATSADTIKRLSGQLDGVRIDNKLQGEQIEHLESDLAMVKANRADILADKQKLDQLHAARVADVDALRSTIVADVVADIRAAIERLDQGA